MIQKLESILNEFKPFIRLMAIVFGIIISFQGLIELVPAVAQLWKPSGNLQTNAAIAIALGIISMK